MEKNNAADLNLFSLSPERFTSILTSLLPSIGRLEELFNLLFQYVTTNFSIRGLNSKFNTCLFLLFCEYFQT